MRISDRKLDQLRLGELSAEEEARVLEALQATGETHRIDQLIASAAHYYERYPAESAVQQIRHAQARSKRQYLDQERTMPLTRTAAAVGLILMATAIAFYLNGEEAPGTPPDPPVASASSGAMRPPEAPQDSAKPLQEHLSDGLAAESPADGRADFLRVLELHAQLDTPTAAEQDAAAQAQFMLAEITALEAFSVSLVGDDEQGLKQAISRKTAASAKAHEEFQKVLEFERPRWSVAARTREGMLFRDLADAIKASPIPARLDPSQREKYREVLTANALPVERRAATAFHSAVELSNSEGISTSDTGAARLALKRLEARGIEPLTE